jgi:hypothetical protein
MYIILKDSIPLGIAVNSALHSILIAHKEWSQEEKYNQWLNHSFKKATCLASEKEFESIKKLGKHLVVTESALNHQEVALIFFPMEKEEIPKGMKFLRLLK